MRMILPSPSEAVIKGLENLKQGGVRYQIIVATHNSNVVVNGDSESVNVMGMCNGQIIPC